MALPSGYTVAIRSVAGAPGDRVTISWQLLNSAGAAISGNTLTVPAIAPQATQQWTADGTQTAFSTAAGAAYGAANAWASVGGVAASPEPAFTIASGALTATFSAAPAAGKTVVVGFDVAAGLNNTAGALASLLGLSAASGTVYSGTVGGVAMSTTHAAVVDLATVLFAWAQATVEATYFA